MKEETTDYRRELTESLDSEVTGNLASGRHLYPSTGRLTLACIHATQKSWIQTQTSFNTISFFEDFTAARYIRDERVHTPDRKKRLESAEAMKHSTFDCSILHIIKERTALCCVTLNATRNVRLKWQQFSFTFMSAMQCYKRNSIANLRLTFWRVYFLINVCVFSLIAPWQFPICRNAAPSHYLSPLYFSGNEAWSHFRVWEKKKVCLILHLS